MNKKVNTILFVLGATLFNILVTILVFLALFAVYIKFIMHSLPESAKGWAFPVIFIAAIAASFVVYRYALRFLLSRIKVEQYFDPIFAGKQRRN